MKYYIIDALKPRAEGYLTYRPPLVFCPRLYFSSYFLLNVYVYLPATHFQFLTLIGKINSYMFSS